MSLLLHCFIGFFMRCVFILYGSLQDNNSEVKYTDVDYTVFTDAASYVLSGSSPYRRHTYRYSPIIAFLLTPNVFLHPVFGKCIFSLLDILIGLIIYKMLKNEGFSKSKSRACSLFWLYNPLSVVISTRGNADSVSALLVLSTTYLFKQKKYIHAGLMHGLSVHFRLYPIVFSLPLYISLKDSSQSKLVHIIYPSVNRIKLVVSSIISFTVLFIIFYHLYGDEFVYESLFFHLKRFDIRHNFSVFFYLQYLSFDFGMTAFHRIAMVTPCIVLLICLPLYYNTSKDLAFCQMCMAFILVSYNSVLTCQYFVWYLCLVPLCLPHVKLPLKQAALLAAMWLLAQLTWLLPAYLLEFRFKETFIFIWIQGLVFFISNVMVIGALIKAYINKEKCY